MLKDAMAYFLEQCKAQMFEVDGREYSSKQLYPVKDPRVSSLDVNSLESIVYYIKNVDENKHLPYLLHIEDYNKVSLFGPICDCWQSRDHFMTAKSDRVVFPFGRFMDTESFIINLQTNFHHTDDLDSVLKVVGNLRDENVRQLGDDGVSQMVTIRTGIAAVGDARVPNPVSLRPYRTFLEIEQPESKFVFRMRDGGSCALFEASGDLWKSDARTSIKEYFESKLSEEIEQKKVILL